MSFMNIPRMSVSRKTYASPLPEGSQISVSSAPPAIPTAAPLFKSGITPANLAMQIEEGQQSSSEEGAGSLRDDASEHSLSSAKTASSSDVNFEGSLGKRNADPNGGVSLSAEAGRQAQKKKTVDQYVAEYQEIARINNITVEQVKEALGDNYIENSQFDTTQDALTKEMIDTWKKGRGKGGSRKAHYTHKKHTTRRNKQKKQSTHPSRRRQGKNKNKKQRTRKHKNPNDDLYENLLIVR